MRFLACGALRARPVTQKATCRVRLLKHRCPGEGISAIMRRHALAISILLPGKRRHALRINLSNIALCIASSCQYQGRMGALITNLLAFLCKSASLSHYSVAVHRRRRRKVRCDVPCWRRAVPVRVV